MREDVVLINPPAEKVVEEYDAPPYGHIGLAYIASALREHSLGCAIIDAKLGRLRYVDVIEMVLMHNPKIVGITSFTHEINMASRVAGGIKRALPDTKIVLGGVHASSLPEETLSVFGAFDFLVRGEGEGPFVRLSESIIAQKESDVSTIPGLAYRKNGRPVLTERAGLIDALDTTGFPAWDLFPKMTIFPVVSSRGCPYQCVFCARMLGTSVRVRSPENVIAELKFLRERFDARNIYFYDETFGFYHGWLDKFLSLMAESPLAGEIAWAITTRAELIDKDIVKRLKNAGCRKIDFGVESGDDAILKAIRKGETKEDFIRAAGLLKKSGIESHSYYILGHPNETKATALNTINFAARLNTDQISIGIMVPYPGTEVARLAAKGEGGYKRLSLDWSDYNKQLGNALELESISRAELTRLQIEGYLKFYIRNMKIIPFLLAIWKYRRLILAIMLKYIKTSADEFDKKCKKV